MHGGLFGARQRLYDVPVAVDVLIGGRYPGLPKGIQYCGGDRDPRPTYEVRLIASTLMMKYQVPSYDASTIGIESDTENYYDFGIDLDVDILILLLVLIHDTDFW